ncbi:hypothetical protein ACFWY6_14810 [Streptomyces sp. NPDC059037]|uniref:hypothetical protein n=1 Tax=Streptomyces sp. NPDC059037 TaxID=3346710 RepID=UPI0036B800D1
MTDATRRTLRTLVQTTIALAATMPAIVQASGIPETLPWVAGALAIAGGLSRVMALPGVQTLMPAWLRTDQDTGGGNG